MSNISTTTSHAVPAEPADPEAAVSQDYAAVLHAEGCSAGLGNDVVTR